MSDLLEGQVAGAVTPDVTVTTSGGVENGEQETVTSEFYTPEEIEDILAENGSLDANKLTPEGKLLQKSFDRGFTKKFEEISTLAKTLKEAVKPKDAVEGWVDRYIDDPKGVTAYVHNQIRSLEDQADPLEPNYKAIRSQIAALQADLDDVRERAKERDTMSTKLDAIPAEVKAFGKAQGFAEKDLLDPKILKAITALHKAEIATQTLRGSVKKKEPSEVTRPGSGTQPSKGKEKTAAELFYG